MRSYIVTDEDDSCGAALFHCTDHRTVGWPEKRHPMIDENKIRSLTGQPLATISPAHRVDGTEKLFAGDARRQPSVVFLTRSWKQQRWILVAKRED